MTTHFSLRLDPNRPVGKIYVTSKSKTEDL